MSANLEHSAVATGLKKGQFSFQSQKSAMPKNDQTIIQLHSFHMRASVVSDSLRPQGLFSPWNSPGQSTGVGSLSLLQGTFPTQGTNPGFPPHYRWILYQLSDKGSQRKLEWVAYPFSSGSSWLRNWIWSPSLQVYSLPTELSGKSTW